ncbi:MAG TPA: acetyl-CoA hydrolase, partial [Marinobacter sp.]|nr:acetyl-CoA hydrolase [Marinobacter sp.]
ADSRFQEDLLAQARKAGKVDPEFRIPMGWRNNTPAHVRHTVATAGGGGLFPAFPTGCDFTEEELVLGKALKALKAATASRRGKMRVLGKALTATDTEGRYQSLLQRMQLDNPRGLRAKLDQRLLVHGLDLTDTSPDKGNQTT